MTEDCCLHQLIEARATTDPDAIAAELDGAVLRYGELQALSDVLARRLRADGVGGDTIVALAMERSLELVVAIVAVLKAGGAYLPIDPGYPRERLTFIIEDAAPQAVLTHSDLETVPSGLGTDVRHVCVAELRNDPGYGREPFGAGSAGRRDLAYVIYTSGSTGRPKGCMVEHAALANRVQWMQRAYPIGPDDAVLQKTPFTFDVSVWELLWPLTVGARMVLARPDGHRDGVYLARCIDEHGVTVCHFVPSMFRQFLTDLEPGRALGLRHVFLSGEALPYGLMRSGMERLPATALHNLYGPTEAAIDVTYWDCELRADGAVPIGRPIDNIEILLLDEQGRSVADGDPGELHIAGAGLARGYLNRPELTAERFFDHVDADGERRRVYKTGDRAQRLPDGNIVYLGRLDFQVKLRGFRIELGEIEAALVSHPAIHQAAVVVENETGEDPRLVAHVVGDEVSVRELRRHLRQKLPDYMVPNRFVEQRTLPLTGHGKVDRDALKDGGIAEDKAESGEPHADGLVERVTALVGRHLDGEQLGPDDDLFDYGATSFTLMRLSRSLQEAFGTTIAVETFLLDPTIRGILNQLGAGGSDAGGADESTAVDRGAAERPSDHTDDHEDSMDSVRTDVERLCREVLGVATLGESDDFFELGATSFTLMRLARAIENELGTAIAIEAFLEEPTLTGVLRHLEAGESAAESNIDDDSAPATADVPQRSPTAGADGYAIEVCLTQRDTGTVGQGEDRPRTDSDRASASKATAAADPVSPSRVSADGQVEDVVARLCRDVLEVDSIDIESDLFELGATSFTLMRLARAVETELGVAIALEAFLEEPTLAGVVRHVQEQLPDSQPGSGANRPAGSMSATAPVQETGATKSPRSAPEPEPAPEAAAGQGGHVGHTLRTIALPKSGNDVRLGTSLSSLAGSGRISVAALGYLLSRLRSVTIGRDHARYLFPSGGGKYAVQVYVVVGSGDVDGLAQGTYYYHPAHHKLYRIGGAAPAEAGVRGGGGVCLVLVGQLKALESTYNRLSPLLATLDAGYMTQLLSDGQAEAGVRLSAAHVTDSERLHSALALDAGHRQLACLAVSGSEGASANEHATAEPLTHLCLETNGREPAVTASYAATDYRSVELSAEERVQYEAGALNVRGDCEARESVTLAGHSYPLSEFIGRASRRDYARRSIPQSAFHDFMALLGGEVERLGLGIGDDARLSELVQFYVLVRPDTIDGLEGGLWRYLPERDELTFVSADAHDAVRKGFYPFNRGHFDQAAFSLLIVGAAHTVNDAARLNAAVVATGMLGQTLMRRQRDFRIGLCPVGWMHLDPVREHLELGSEAEFVHGFTGGYYDHDQPVPLSALDRRESDTSRFAQAAGAAEPRGEMAIIGMSGRYPGADDVWQLWRRFEDAECMIGPLPSDRWGSDELHGGFLDAIERFDSLLFNITPVEARSMDPQERLFLEVVWECLESAGYTPDTLRAAAPRVGVFVGVMWGDYQKFGARSDGEPGPTSTYSSIPNRVSHFFDFQGPSMAVDTGCSSALTALHMACESVRNGECDAAVVGGVNLVGHPDHIRVLRDLELVSPDQTCQVFGADADGWVVGEGVGAVLVRPAEAARRDADARYAIIRGTAAAHRGRSRGRTMPNADGQAQSLRALMQRCAVEPGTISYVEASAAGSGIADAAEVSSVERVLGESRHEGSPYLIGSAKANLGHLEAASGMAQLAKVVLQLQYGRIVPTPVPDALNPFIDWQSARGVLAVSGRTWDAPSSGEKEGHSSRRALINGYSAEGSCSHAIVEEPIAPSEASTCGDRELIVLSAATQAQLRTYAQRLATHLSYLDATAADARPAVMRHASLCDVAFTLQNGRVPMPYRLATIAGSLGEAAERLRRFASGDVEVPALASAHTGADPGGRQTPVRAPTLEAAMTQWLEGATIDWSALRHTGAQRVPLPSYPFAGERHWIPTNTPGAVAGSQAAWKTAEPTGEATDPQNVLAEWLCGMYAEEAELPVDRVRPDVPLENLGLNSLLITRMNRRLDGLGIGIQRRTLLFEFRTLGDVAAYLLANHAAAVTPLLQSPEAPASSSAQAADGRPASVAGPSGATGEAPSEGDEPIAVIGMAMRYPEADSAPAFWDNLISGRCSIGEIPPERWDWRQHYDETRGRAGFNYSRFGAFVAGAEHFDPLFFNIAPSEAESMDPQERLFLQTAWSAVEDAGRAPGALGEAGRVGVFVGVMNDTYERAAAEVAGRDAAARAQVTRYWSIANRVSYQLDVRGPSMAVDTACSSSLAAVHLACESLRRSECELALAGGVNLVLHPSHFISLSSVTMLSSDGRCRPFGDRADGTVIGEGAGCILLKPLRRAIEDGDHIHGVIRGSAINSDGRTNGYTVANPQAQGEVVGEALRRAGVHPRTITYLEAHGTGTALGDPIEIEGLCQAFTPYTDDRQYCALGSVKSNIGHLESAAGIAGLTKVLLQLQHGRYAPTLHAEPANPDIDFSATPFSLRTAPGDWQRPVLALDGNAPVEYPRRAGVSSFGAGGVNVHLVVEEHRPGEQCPDRPTDTERNRVIVLSAKRRERLAEAARQLRAFLTERPSVALDDVAYTLQTGREAMACRLAILAPGKEALMERLARCAGGDFGGDGVFSGEVRMPAGPRAPDRGTVIEADSEGIAAAWVRGERVDWETLPENQGARRVPLPTYPFARQAYWIGGARLGNGSGEPAEVPREGDSVDELPEAGNAVDWSSGLVVPVYVRDDGPRRSGLPGTVWVLDGDGTTSSTLRELAGSAERVVRIRPGAAFQRHDADEFAVDPTDPGQYRQLVDALLNAGLTPSAVINAWVDHPFETTLASVETQLRQGFYPWVYLTQALSQAGHRQRTRLIAWNPVDAPSEHPLAGAQESLLRTIAAELSWAAVTVVEATGDPGETASGLVNELWATGPESMAVRYEGGRRLRKGYEPIQAADARPMPPGPGVYLIAGGAGGIGRRLARHLVRTTDAAVVLLGRSRLAEPARKDLEAEAPGRLAYYQADICDAEALDVALRDIRARLGPLVAVIHCAGVLHNAPVTDKQPLAMSAVLGPKVFGTANLDRLTREDPLECFLLFSSLTAEIASPGQIDYAFANGFADHFARWREGERRAGRCSGRALSVDWPYWHDGGMAIEPEILDLLQARWGVEAIDSGKGLSLLDRLWACEASQVLVVPGDPARVQRTLGFACTDVQGAPVRPVGEEAGPALAELLVDEIAGVSKIEPELVDQETPLTEYGFDSVMLTRLAHRLSERLGLAVTPSDLVEQPTVASLQSFLASAGHNDAVPLAAVAVGGGGSTAGMPEPVREQPSAAGTDGHTPETVTRETQCRHPWLGSLDGGRVDRLPVVLDGTDPVLRDHRISGDVLLPGAGYLEIARAAGVQGLDCGNIVLGNVSWQRPLRIEPHGTTEIEIRLDSGQQGYGFRVVAPGEADAPYAQGTVEPLTGTPAKDRLDLDAIRQSCTHLRHGDTLYADMAHSGFEYGPLYRSIEVLYTGQGEALARLSLGDGHNGTDGFVLHPALLDGAFQAAIGATADANAGERVHVPFFLRSVRQFEALPDRCWVHVRRSSRSTAQVERFDIVICDVEGKVLVEVDEFTVRPLSTTVHSGPPAEPHAPAGTPGKGNPEAASTQRTANGGAGRSAERIAVVGVAGRFPQSPDVDTYWRHLVEGNHLVSEVDPQRWDWREHFDPAKGTVRKTYSRWAGYAPGVESYDPAFFGIREADARAMDPQHLLVLELSQHLFDNAGYHAKELAGRNVSVILGAAAGDCAAINDPTLPPEVAKGAVVHSIQNMIAARVSDFYDLRGESYTIDTACSSSLVAIHHACRALRSGECDMAVAGGITLLLDEQAHVRFSQASVLSDDPCCYVFDQRAKGFVLGEGAGLVLLKRYDDAVADGDRIMAVVSGSAVNNDGRTMGITTPNVEMQHSVIRRAIDNAGVHPRSITYLEAHGTGTLLGDPIEIKAASRAYGEFTEDRQYCAVGSVKSNTGHLLLAAGVASFIKVVMMLQQRYIPRTLHCDKPHPRFEFERSPFRPALQGAPWDDFVERRCAAISGFGFGGTNCHMILEEFTPEDGTYRARREPLPPTQFERRRCWWPCRNDATGASRDGETADRHTAGGRPRTYEELVEALQQGRISVEEAVALEPLLGE